MFWGLIIFTVVAGVAVIVLAWQFFTSYEPDSRNHPERIDSIDKVYNRDINALASSHQVGKSMRSTQLANVLSQEIGAISNLEGTKIHAKNYMENLEYEQNQKRVDALIAHKGKQLEIANTDRNHKQALLETRLMEEAEKHGLTPDAYVEWRKQELLDEQERLHESRKAADETRAAIVVGLLKDHAQMCEIQGLIDQKLIEISQLQKGNLRGEPVDKDTARLMIDSRQKMVRAWETQLNGLQQRLLQDDNGQDFRGTRQKTELWRDTGQELEETEDLR